MENLEVMVILFIIVILGYVACKLGYMGDKFDKKLSSMVVDITCPLLVLSSVMGDELPDRTLILPLLGVGFLTYILSITVAYKIVEGTKERIQLYRGVVIKISGHGDKKRFTVRKMSGTVGVERIFPIESPAIDSIEVNKHGKVRRAKLYYLRKLTGKKARIAEKKTVTKGAE